MKNWMLSTENMVGILPLPTSLNFKPLVWLKKTQGTEIKWYASTSGLVWSGLMIYWPKT
jgi:hypothetical protein